MRVEATISDPSGDQLSLLAKELGVSKSQIVEEALALFVKAMMEARKGRRLAIVEAKDQRTVCEIASPSLTQVEWTAHRESIVLNASEFNRIAGMISNPPKPNERLKAALKGKKA